MRVRLLKWTRRPGSASPAAPRGLAALRLKTSLPRRLPPPVPCRPALRRLPARSAPPPTFGCPVVLLFLALALVLLLVLLLGSVFPRAPPLPVFLLVFAPALLLPLSFVLVLVPLPGLPIALSLNTLDLRVALCVVKLFVLLVVRRLSLPPLRS